MQKTLTLSIVIPAFNEEKHLKACLDAIAKQTSPPDEVIVVDNNSTDRTVEIAKTYEFVTIIQEPKQGIVFARDSGFNAAKCDLIGRIDADSLLFPGWVHYVKRFYSEEHHKDHALTGGGIIYNLRFPRFAGWVQGQIAFRINRLLLGHYILFGTNMVIPKHLWDETKTLVCHYLDQHEDLDLAIHVNSLGYPITYRESLRVGLKVRRVRSNRRELLENMMWWPHTLKRHGRWTWVFGWLGAVLLYALSPIINLVEYVARVFGRKPLEE
ncbi:MAG: glycosyltransferase family A protein [Patescibacteria group bacterium]